VAKKAKRMFHNLKFWTLAIIAACLVWLRMQLKQTSVVFKAVDDLINYVALLLPMHHYRLALASNSLKHPKPSEKNGSRRISLVHKPKKKK